MLRISSPHRPPTTTTGDVTSINQVERPVTNQSVTCTYIHTHTQVHRRERERRPRVGAGVAGVGLPGPPGRFHHEAL